MNYNNVFVSWCKYYNEHLWNMYNITCYKLNSSSLISYNEFCNWVWRNTENHLKNMQLDKKYENELRL
jgi:hypothetical protein